MSSEDSFKNPFADYNAVVMDPSQILDFWCNPFNYIHFSQMSETDIYMDKMPIILTGGRGSGKTMFLKYYSYPVQIEKYLRENKTSKIKLINLLEKNNGIGFYIRIDGAKLKGFQGSGIDSKKWDEIFIHFFELIICRTYLDFINVLINSQIISTNFISDNFLSDLAGIMLIDKIDLIDEAINYIEDSIQYVEAFRSKVALENINFNPKKLFLSESLSYGIINLLRKHFDNEFSKLKILIMIDEYENFSENQQRLINTMLKFVREGITFRIGMRLEGFNTYDTISDNEFIKEGRDYRTLYFDDVINKDRHYQKYLKTIASKRLKSVEFFKELNLTNIETFLGKRENLEEEARLLVKSRKNKKIHFNLISNEKRNEAIKSISNEKNPLQELLNIIWVNRGKSIELVQKSMNLYNEKNKKVESLNDDLHKYKRDYVDKYKLSLMILLASLYRTNKLYYSFNTLAFLSSGIVGTFIELCRKTFDFAFFSNRSDLFKGAISEYIQDRACREVAKNELNMVTRIPFYGDKLFNFITNLGNIFSAYHKDHNLTYPETNQFAISAASLQNRENKNAFNSALRWSLIQKKPKLQNITSQFKREVYILNRIFTPLYNLSYRTRGGYSREEYNEKYLERLFTLENILPKANLHMGNQKLISSNQTNLFEQN